MQSTPTRAGIVALKEAVMDLVALVNQSPLSGRLLQDVETALDPALLRIAGLIVRFGPVGIGELSQQAGRDHTTVSRQVSRLEELGLVERRAKQEDGRVSEVVLTAKGRRTAAMFMTAQNRILAEGLAGWSEKDLADLIRLMERLTRDLQTMARSADK